jgi:hypothetical protein
MMVINPGGLKGRGSLILNSNSDHHHKYALKPFKIIGPSNANFVIASATSHDAASASIHLSQSSIGRITKPLIMH